MSPLDPQPRFQDSTLRGALTEEIALSRGLDPVARPAVRASMFDACHVGVVLRAVLFVEAVVAVGAMFGAADISSWLLRFSLLTSGALPGTLGWLVVMCAMKKMLHRRPVPQQWALGVALGAGWASYGCGLLWAMGLLQPAAWWASASAGALLAAVIMAGLFWRARAQAPATTAARLAELQARIRPHFLFNTLNSAIALVRAEPARAEAVLEDLSELFRHALADLGDAVTLAQEIELAQRYLAIEQVRFAERLRVHWDLDASAGQARLPPLLLQPLVENAVRHGVEPSPSGADIHIVTQRRGNTVVVKVINTSPSGAGARGNGLALANVRERLVLLHDVQSEFLTGSRDGVFLVRLEVPA